MGRVTRFSTRGRLANQQKPKPESPHHGRSNPDLSRSSSTPGLRSPRPYCCISRGSPFFARTDPDLEDPVRKGMVNSRRSIAATEYYRGAPQLPQEAKFWPAPFSCKDSKPNDIRVKPRSKLFAHFSFLCPQLTRTGSAARCRRV